MPNLKNKTKFNGSSIPKNVGWLEKYGDGGKTLEQKINKALGDPRKKASDAAINKKWFNKETKKWEVEDDIDNFRHPMAARYTAEAISNKFPDWMKYSGIPQVAGFVGSTALGVAHELANNKYTSNDPKDYPNYTFWDTVSEAGEDAFNNMVGAGVGVLPISDDKKTSFLRYLSDNNKIPDGYANKKANMYFKRNGGLIDTYGDNPKAQVGKALKEYENDKDPISHLKWGKYIDDPKRREQHIIDVYQYLMDSNWEPSSIVDFMKKNGSYGSKNRGNIAKKGADWGWDSEDINNEVLGKAWDDYYNNRTVYDKKEYGGWLENYGDGGETDQNPLLKSKTLLLEGNDENPQDLGPDANRSGFGINDKKIHISDNRKIRATTGKKINPNVALKTGDYDENVIDSLIKYSIKYNIDPNRVLAQGLAESTFGKKDSQNIGHLKHFYKNESPYPQMMEAILEGDRLAKTNKNKKTTREEIIQGYNGYGKLFPETEKDYHGGNSKAFYEVPFGKEGYLDMDKNPLYGIEIKDLMDNVISKDAQIQYKILNSKNPIKKEFYNPNNVKIPYRRKDFKYGGIVKTLQNKQDNSQWLEKYGL